MRGRRKETFELELLDEATRERRAVRSVEAAARHFIAHRDVWRPMLAARNALDAEWNWLLDFEQIEAPSLEWESYALVDSEQTVHALMSLQLQPEIVYVDRLAVAPWNRPGPVLRRLVGCGSAMLIHAVRKSFAKGYGGRVALHSLEDEATLRFYRDRIKMTEIRIDNVDGTPMRYFVLDEQTAERLVEGRAP